MIRINFSLLLYRYTIYIFIFEVILRVIVVKLGFITAIVATRE